MRVADAIFKRLEQETSAIYYVPGGSAMFLIDALGRSKLKRVSAIHEQGAGFAAIGHAMSTGTLGVALATSGPGAMNMTTACLAAWTDSIPVLFITGQARTEALGGSDKLRTQGLQPADIISHVHTMTKFAYQPMTSGQDCLMALDRMIAECLSGRRGPCWLSVPQDIQAMQI
jgi:acetolactate synthase-1/2/3 large subunit